MISSDKGKWSEDRKELHTLVHVLWTKAVGGKGYSKLEWIAFEGVIDKL